MVEVRGVIAKEAPAAVIIPLESGFRVVIRSRPDLTGHEAAFHRLSLAESHAKTVAAELGLDLVITAAAFAAHRRGVVK